MTTTEMRPCPFQLPEGFSGDQWAPTHKLHTHAASLAYALHGANPHPDDAEPRELLRAAQFVREMADEAMQEVVVHVRAGGMTWDEVGKALGVTRQAAQKRFSVPGVEDGVCPDCGGSFAGLIVRGKIGYHSSSPGQRCSGVGKAAPKGAVR